MMRIAATLKLQPYPCTLTLKTLKRGLPNDVDGLTTIFDDGSIDVAIRADLDPNCKLLTCIHEAVHVVQFIQQRVETKIDEETEAYLIQSIVKWMMQKLKLSASADAH